MQPKTIWNNWQAKEDFSGVFATYDATGLLYEAHGGFRNKSERLENNIDTAFGIASGTKLFTGLLICKLIEAGKIALEDKIWEILPYDLGEISKAVTIKHLLTHTSGIGDYIEEAGDAEAEMQALYEKYPVYLWERLSYYLPMITPLAAKFSPGKGFSYCNAGFVLLGLVAEAVTETPYQTSIREEIILPLHLTHTGFYRTDQLPGNTGHGYLKEADGWHTNIFKIPVIGGADGGLYSTAADMDQLWRSLFAGEILRTEMLETFLAAHAKIGKQKSYGLGVYRYTRGGNTAYYAVGSDFGVTFFSAYAPRQQISASFLANENCKAFSLLEEILKGFTAHT